MIAKLASLPLVDPVSLADGPAVVERVTTLRRSADYDLIILGGGCAGLSLAMRLASLGVKCPRTLVIEKRPEYTNDRTWCFWGKGSPQVNHLASHAWQRVTLRSESRSVEVDCGVTPYQMIPGQAFYVHALQAIEASQRIDLLKGVSLLSEPRNSGHEWHLETSEGSYSGAAVIDTRPSHSSGLQNVLLWQSFCGSEIECESPVFDPTTVELMDFSKTHKSRIHFTYLLPLSRTRALVETTAFALVPLTAQDLSSDLSSAIASRVQGRRFRSLRSESGILPMGTSLARNSPHPTFIRAGLTAGAARPSTGYAFQRIQRWADSCVQLIADGKPPISHKPDPLVLRGLDHLFVSVLRSRPELGPELFLSLFEKTDTERLIRFLSDQGTIADYAAIASVLPVFPFIREIPKAVLRKAAAQS